MVGGRQKMTVAIYLKGVNGVGKGGPVRLLGKLVGMQNFVTISDQNLLMSQFNGHLAGNILLFIDDCKLTGNNFMDFGDRMKTLITEPTITVRALYKNAITIDNMTSVIASGNQDIGNLNDVHNGRIRWLQLDLQGYLESNEYYVRLNNLIDNDPQFLEAMYLYCVRNYDKDFNPQTQIKLIPATKTKIETIQKCMPVIPKMLKHYLIDEPADDLFDTPMKFKDLYFNYYLEWNKVHNLGKNPIQKQQFYNDVKAITSYITFINQIRVGNDPFPTKNALKINKVVMIDEFIKKHYIVESDEFEVEQYQTPEKKLEVNKLAQADLMNKLKALQAEQELLLKEIEAGVEKKPVKRIIPVESKVEVKQVEVKVEPETMIYEKPKKIQKVKKVKSIMDEENLFDLVKGDLN